MKLLLAEDDAQVRTELRELLSEEGYTVVTASDGIEAFEKFRDDKDIDVLLLDIRMPRCTGLQTLDAIRKIDVGSERIFETIFITGNNDSDSVVSALKLGALSFLFKPIVVEQLLAEIDAAKESVNQRRYKRLQREVLEAQIEENKGRLSQLTQELDGGYTAAIHMLALSAEHYIPGIELHIHRVGEMASVLANRLGFEKKDVQNIRFAAALHDIGKLKGPEELYNAERKLTSEEFEITKAHTHSGEEFLSHSSNPVFKLAAVIAAQHHEHHDGSGYPNGLEGDEIAIEAAIMHAVDVYENLRAPRPYREELPHHIAIGIMIDGDDKSSPDHFHPRVLQALLAQHRDIEAIYERYRPTKA